MGPSVTLAASIGPADNGHMTANVRVVVPAQREESSDTGVDDKFLAASVVGGDPAALRQLLSRYDRLVRYTVFHASRQRCHDDPQWLDSVASATWTGFVQSLNRAPDQLPNSIPAYLARIAKNQTVSALRKRGVDVESLDARDDEVIYDVDSEAADPLEVLSKADDLEALRACLDAVVADDRPMLGQLEAITSRQWKDAATVLGIAESTLRSRWSRLLDRLRTCMKAKRQKHLAPPGGGCD